MDAEQPRERPLVLVVDDVAPVIRMMTLELDAQGFDVIGSRVGEDTFRTIEKYRPDVAVMEVVLPGILGFELLAEVKRRYRLPVVFVTTQNNDGDRQYALELGADDYITKPFVPAELTQRLRAVLPQGREAAQRDHLRVGSVEIDFGRKRIARGGNELSLTTNEWALLLALSEAHGATMPSSDLLAAVWGGDYASETRYLEVWIERLRTKVEEDLATPRVIVGDAGSGFAIGRPFSETA